MRIFKNAIAVVILASAAFSAVPHKKLESKQCCGVPPPPCFDNPSTCPWPVGDGSCCQAPIKKQPPK